MNALGTEGGKKDHNKGQGLISRFRKKDFSIIFIVQAKFLTTAMIKEGPFVSFEVLVAPMNLKEDGGYLTRVFSKENREKTEEMKTNETTSEDHFFYKWFIRKEITWKPGFTISQPIIHFM